MNHDSVKQNSAASGGAVYALGFIGALIYFFQQANDFGDFVGGFFMAIFWPAFMVHRALELLNF